MSTNLFSRQKFLKASGGAMMFLPQLPSIMGAQPKQKRQKAVWFYLPNGVYLNDFYPQGLGFTDLKPGEHKLGDSKTLKALAPVYNKVSLITNLDKYKQQGTDPHAQSGCCFLSSAPLDTIKTSSYPLDRTLDQKVGDHIGQITPFRTLEFSCNHLKDNKEPIFFDNISWYGPDYVAPSMRDPLVIYNRLFNAKGGKSMLSITDLILQDAKRLSKRLDKADKDKFDEYFESIRTIEKQVHGIQAKQAKIHQLNISEPEETMPTRREYMTLMMDLMAVALQADLTHVATMMISPERWGSPVMYEDLFDKAVVHHSMSHGVKKYADGLQKIDHFNLQMACHFLQKLDAIKEEDGSTLLDNSIVTIAAGLGKGDSHLMNKLPVLVAGSGGGKIKTGVHLHCPEGADLNSLWLAQARLLGAPLKSFGDCEKPLNSILKTSV